jgi:AcrR family transcriptional regulator
MPISRSSSKPRRKQEDLGSIRRRIVAGARTHFFAHGFRAVTMDDLAEELGMSKKTLYANFDSKTALLEAVLTLKFHDLEIELSQLASLDPQDIASSMRRFLNCLQQHFQEIQPPFVRDVHRSEPELFRSISDRRRKLVEAYFAPILSEGRKKGLIRADIPVRLITEILLETIDSVINPKKILELKITPEKALSVILTIFLDGLILGSDDRD